MSDTANFEKYRAYFLSQKDRQPLPSAARPPFVTLSRQTGAGAETVAKLLAEKLNARLGKDDQPWTVLDKDLLHHVLEDAELPAEIARLVPEDKDTTVQSLVGELLGLHPSMWTIFHHTSDTILKLARLGRCIIVGRGAEIITAKLKSGVHARLVAPEATRIAHLKTYFKMDADQAAKYLREHDEGRRRYVKTNFDKDIEDPLLYHATLNTGLLTFEQTADVLVGLVASR